MKALTVGQNVYVNGGFGPVEAKVIKVEPLCVYVETGLHGQLRFNNDGKECHPNGKAYTYEANGFDPGPWELEEPWIQRN